MVPASSGTLKDSHVIEGLENNPSGLAGRRSLEAASIYLDPPDEDAAGQLNAPGMAAKSHAEAILTWSDLTYTVETKTSSRTILGGITGAVRAGETIAIIGSSGAGKTTLLNTLSGRLVGGVLSGEVLFHGAKRNPGTYKRLTAYVQQDDIMHAMLTVDETLTYASKLRLPNSQYTVEDKAERVKAIIKQLRLEGIKDSQIGNAKIRGVSGGERKRVSIGAELLTDPHILFLDEPTSGLDSNSSQLVVELVRQIAQERQIGAMMTIHQPSARIFNTFDKVILLAQGRVVYFGPTSLAINYFRSIGYQCPVHENPADYFIDLLTLDYRSDKALDQSKTRITELSYKFTDYRNSLDTPMRIRDQVETASRQSTFAVDVYPRNNWFLEYQTLAHRDWLNLVRNMMFLASQAFQSLVTGLIVGFMFFYLKHDSISVQNRLGVLYVIVLNGTFPVVMPSLQAYVNERDIMLRERSAAVYRVTTFYVSKATSFLPIALSTGVVFIVGTYFISHLVFDAGKFFIALGVFASLNVVSIAFMLLMGSSVDQTDVAFVIGPAILTLQLLFGGLLANPTTITPVLRWIRWINPVYYAYAALVQNEFDGMDFECSVGSQCYTDGQQVIDTYSMGRFSVGGNILFLLLIAAVYFVAGYAMLRWKIKPKYIWV